MSKPSTLPRWATDGGAPVNEPSEGRKDAGWAPSDRPAAQHINWLFKWIYTGLAWLLDQFGDTGLKRVQSFDTAPDLRALTTHATGDVAIVFGVGLFQYLSASSVADDGLNSIKPTDVGVGNGRWLRTDVGIYGQANGLATLDANARVPTAQLGGFAARAWGYIETATGGGANYITRAGSGNFTVSYSGDDLVITLNAALGSAYGIVFAGEGLANTSTLVWAKMNSSTVAIISARTTGGSTITLSSNAKTIAFAIFGPY